MQIWSLFSYGFWTDFTNIASDTDSVLSSRFALNDQTFNLPKLETNLWEVKKCKLG